MKTSGIIALLICSIYGKPFNITDEPTCGYSSCHAVDPNKINVHLIPHSHDDVGWLSTVDQYYFNDVQYIISSVVESLLVNSDRRFIQVETAFFYKWWNQQQDSVKSIVKQLINEGRLEIVNGAWSMNDEALVHYQSTIDQYTLGLKFIEDNLGKCARPRVSWQIDPFGHGREQASLLTQFGMDGVFFARMDYRDREKRKKSKTMDFLWTGSANLGNDSNIFTSQFYKHYSAPDHFCFDIDCDDPPIVTDKESFEYNWETRVNEFVNIIKEQYTSFPTNNLLIPMGDDFKWKAAHKGYINIDRLIEGFKLFNPKIDDKEINVIYSTPSCYTKAVHDYVEANKVNLDVKTDDFFPFAEFPTIVLTGYYSSRPSSKRLERFANNLLQVAKQITTLAGKPYDTNKLLSQAMGVMQHHDAITGTEKVHVEKDYHKSLVKGMQKAISDINTSFLSILGLANDLNLKSCLLSNVSVCSESDKDEFSVLIYNPLARNTSHYIQIPVNDGTWKITNPSGEDVESHLTEPIRNFDYITKDIGEKVLGKVLFFRAEDLPALGYKVYKFKKISSESNSTRAEVGKIDRMGFDDKYVEFDLDTGLLKSITLNGENMAVSQKMMYYVSGGSSAYVFEPESQTNAVEFGDVKSSVLINEGNLVREIKQVWKDWVTQIIRIYKEEDFIEFDWLIGPVDVSDGKGKEIITRYSTELDPNEEFYTDANGREMIYRKKNYRPTFQYTDEEPQAGNYYPVATKILVKDGKREFAVLPDRSEGGASLSSGEVELMLNRALVIKDFFGENLNEEEYQQALVVRGSHFVTLGDSSRGNGGRTMAAVERDIAQRKLLQPWLFYTSEDIPVKEQSFLNKELPANVHLLTLEPWNQEENSFLIRLEHILEKDEDPELSKEVTVDISVII